MVAQLSKDTTIFCRSQEEAAYLDFKISLSRNLRDIRKKKRWSQVDLAKAIGSSQSRVAKMEASDRSVSVDLLVKSLLAVGASYGDLAKAISAGGEARRATASLRVLRFILPGRLATKFAGHRVTPEPTYPVRLRKEGSSLPL